MKFCVSLVRVMSCLCLTTLPGLADTTFSISPAVSTNLVGSTIQLALVQTGDPSFSFDFQWLKDGAPIQDTDRIFGTQQPALTISSCEPSDAGIYSLVFSNAFDTNITQVTVSATVFVVSTPVIENLSSVTMGAGVTFTVVASGGLLSYQWTWQGQDIPGATNSSLLFSNAFNSANAGFYGVRVSNPVLPSGEMSTNALLFTKPVPAGTYQGLFSPSDAVTSDSCGFMQFTLSASKRSFSGKLILDRASYRFAGTFSTAHQVLLTVQGPGGEPLELDLQLLTTNDLPSVIGTISAESWTASVLGHRLYFSSKNPTSLAGKYTLSLANTNTASAVPNGSGYGTVVIGRAGTVAVSGRAADGATFSQSCGLSRVGEWPLYASLSGGKERLIGWLQVKQGAPALLGTNLVWLKVPSSDTFYPDGFNLSLQPLGSTYLPPSTNSILNLTNAVAALYGGDLAIGNDGIWDFVRVWLRPSKTFITERGSEDLRLTVTRSTGIVSGNFIDLTTGRRSGIRGVVLQQQTSASGYFLSTDTAGAFVLAPAAAGQ